MFICTKCKRELPLSEKDVLMSCYYQKPICKKCADRISEETGKFLRSVKGKLADHPFIVKLSES